MDSSFSQILSNEAWYSRLGKPHSQLRALPKERRAQAKELDSSNSSDALLMNIFCYPGIETTDLIALLQISRWQQPCFGVSCLLPGERKEHPTELDMVVGDVSFEAKLMERDFTSKSQENVLRYRDLTLVFEVDRLSRSKDRKKFKSYQLIRNVLAAYHRGGRFVLLCDERRPDLVQDWQAIRDNIKERALRDRCVQVSWQQIATVCQFHCKAF
jgi:restriction endonuclease-like protein